MNEELLHYGVKGMRWGVIRTPEQLGHVRVGKMDENAGNSNLGSAGKPRSVREASANANINKYLDNSDEPQRMKYKGNDGNVMVAYEALRRGYDVTAAPRTADESLMKDFQEDMGLGYIDPKTGMRPKATKIQGEITDQEVKRLKESMSGERPQDDGDLNILEKKEASRQKINTELNELLEEGGRYAIKTTAYDYDLANDYYDSYSYVEWPKGGEPVFVDITNSSGYEVTPILKSSVDGKYGFEPELNPAYSGEISIGVQVLRTDNKNLDMGKVEQMVESPAKEVQSIIFVDPEDDNLLHYGVKGMRWGVIRTPEQLGHKVSQKRSSFSNKVTKSMKKAKKENAGRAAKKAAKEENAGRAAKKLGDLSDEELKKRIDRLNMEERYEELVARQKERKNRGFKAIVKKALGEAFENLGKRLLNEVVVDKIVKRAARGKQFDIDEFKDMDVNAMDADTISKVSKWYGDALKINNSRKNLSAEGSAKPTESDGNKTESDGRMTTKTNDASSGSAGHASSRVEQTIKDYGKRPGLDVRTQTQTYTEREVNDWLKKRNQAMASLNR